MSIEFSLVRLSAAPSIIRLLHFKLDLRFLVVAGDDAVAMVILNCHDNHAEKFRGLFRDAINFLKREKPDNYRYFLKIQRA